ncbi:MAG: hypothetical protein K0Q50_1369 [Vampirovibrio sp.]|jgi:hypothetical protein|nr:hypothetical protein [Vampirovibrio sp.]
MIQTFTNVLPRSKTTATTRQYQQVAQQYGSTTKPTKDTYDKHQPHFAGDANEQAGILEKLKAEKVAALREKYRKRDERVKELLPQIEQMERINPENGRKITAIDVLRLVVEVVHRGTTNADQEHAFETALKIATSHVENRLSPQKKTLWPFFNFKKPASVPVGKAFNLETIFDKTDIPFFRQLVAELEMLDLLKLVGESGRMYLTDTGRALLDYQASSSKEQSESINPEEVSLKLKSQSDAERLLIDLAD